MWSFFVNTMHVQKMWLLSEHYQNSQYDEVSINSGLDWTSTKYQLCECVQ